mmetsp:Transcript_57596/g.166724  ORF Transcript_57596/g.166724 Transcript_57596/m.166724 type:complete len:1331 (-) Transcript_57596:116-4108(-)
MAPSRVRADPMQLVVMTVVGLRLFVVDAIDNVEVDGEIACNCTMCTVAGSDFLADKCCSADLKGLWGTLLAFERDPLFAPRLSEFAACTGARVTITYNPSGEDGMSDALQQDVGTSYRVADDALVESAGAGVYDAYVVQAPWLPAVADGMDNLSPKIARTPELDWLDINSVSRQIVSFDSTVRALPLDVDVIAYGYRQDVFDAHNKKPPETLEELAELSEYFNGKDHNDDGEPDWGFCITPQPNYFMAFVAPYLQTTQKVCREVSGKLRCDGEHTGQNLFFNISTFEPFLENAAVREAAQLFWRVVMSSNCPDQMKEPGTNPYAIGSCDRRSAFRTGKCAGVISMPGSLNGMLLPLNAGGSNSPRRVDENGTVVWTPATTSGVYWGRRKVFPGTPRVLDFETGTLRECDTDLCPKAIRHPDTGKLVNYVPFFAEGGESYAIRESSSEKKKELMWTLFTWLGSLPSTALPLSGFYRESQIQAGNLDALTGVGWPVDMAQDLFAVLGYYFTNPEQQNDAGVIGNSAMDLVMIGFSEYMNSINDAFIKRFYLHPEVLWADDPTVYPAEKYALAEARLVAAYSGHTAYFGRLQQIGRWRAALNLPILSTAEICTTLFDTLVSLGENLNQVCAEYISCPAGTGYSTDANRCVPCDPGYFSLEGRDGCRLCEPGTYRGADMDGGACQLCPAQTFAPNPGATECLACPSGSSQSERGQVACQCDIGFYRDPEDPSTMGSQATLACLACENVVPGSTTRFPGSTRSSDCQCGVGGYLTGGICKACADDFPAGSVSCAGFGAKPMLLPGWMTIPTATTVFMCQSDEACPGGVAVGIESCGEGSSGITCSKCDPDYAYEVRTGRCGKCTTGGQVLFVVVLLGALAMVTVLATPHELVWGTKSLQKSLFSTCRNVIVAHMLDLAQFCAILGASAIQWEGTSGGLFRGMTTAITGEVLSIECIIGGSDREHNVLARMILINLTPAIFIAFVFGLSAFAPLVRGSCGLRFPTIVQASNVSIIILTALFMTILNNAINQVFSTYSHPGSDERSLVSFPFILTSDPFMDDLMIVAIASIMVWCVGTVCFVMYLMLFLPKHKDNINLRRGCITLLNKFKFDSTWWVLFDLLVKILVSISVSIFDIASTQTEWMATVYIGYLFLLIIVQPYHFKRHWLSDIILTCGKLLILAYAGTLVAAVVIAGLVWATLAGFLAWALYDTWTGEALDPSRDDRIIDRFAHGARNVLPPQDCIAELVPPSDPSYDGALATRLEQSHKRRASFSSEITHRTSSDLQKPAQTEPEQEHSGAMPQKEANNSEQVQLQSQSAMPDFADLGIGWADDADED